MFGRKTIFHDIWQTSTQWLQYLQIVLKEVVNLPPNRPIYIDLMYSDFLYSLLRHSWKVHRTQHFFYKTV